MSHETERGAQQGPRAEHERDMGLDTARPATSMLGSVAGSIGAAPLQRKLAQRVQRRMDTSTAATAESTSVQMKEKLGVGEEAFQQMWDAHPHNYQNDESQNTQSADLLKDQGLPDWIGNTCAVRLSTMLNNSGFPITPEKTKAAGIARAPTYSKKTKHYYILAASEMWNYISKNFRKADHTFPPSGIYKDADAFQAAYDKEIKPIVSAGKGIVAFETIFGYGGTGHVDLHDGESLSDAPNWYPCKRLHLWNIVVA